MVKKLFLGSGKKWIYMSHVWFLFLMVIIVLRFLGYEHTLNKMAEKVYEPEVIQETPFPGEPSILDTQSQSIPGGNYSPTTTKDKLFKRKVVAHETIASALNTRSRKILQEFDLEQSGGFKIGDFKQGVTGDLRITPNGLIARDSAGINTFAIDGTTGSAVFRGTVQAGDVVVLDDQGLVSLANFQSDSLYVDATTTLDYTTDTSFTDVIGDLEITLTRETRVLIGFDAAFQPAIGYSFGEKLSVWAAININDTLYPDSDFGWGPMYEITSSGSGDDLVETLNRNGGTYSIDLSSGVHTIKVQAKVDSDFGSDVDARISAKSLWAIALGS
jgi:hypothetical protein